MNCDLNIKVKYEKEEKGSANQWVRRTDKGEGESVVFVFVPKVLTQREFSPIFFIKLIN